MTTLRLNSTTGFAHGNSQELRLLRPQGKIQQAMARGILRGTALAIGLGLGLAGCGVSFAPFGLLGCG